MAERNKVVFISYSDRDSALVEPLVIQIGVFGNAVQFEQKLIAGSVRWQEVFDSIQNCDVFLFALTYNALASDSRALEYSYASALGKPIITVLLSDLQEAVPPEIRSVIDLRQQTGAEYARLRTALQQVEIVPIVKSTVVPDWLQPLTRLRQQVITPHLDATDQATILLNLEEFLERQDTFAIAEGLLQQFVARTDLDGNLKREAQATLSRITSVYSQQRRARLRNMVVGGVLLAFILAGILFFTSRLITRSRADQQAAAALTATAMVDESALSNVTPAGTDTFPGATDEPLTESLTTTVEITLPATTLLPTQTGTARSSATVTPIPPLATQLQPTAIPPTSVPPTSVPPTPIPPTPVPPTPVPPTPVPPTPIPPTPIPPTPVPPTLIPPTPIPPTPVPPTLIPPTLVIPTLIIPTVVVPTLDLDVVLPDSVFVGIRVEDSPQGVRVTEVGTNATNAGIQVGDLVTAIDLLQIVDAESFRTEMNRRNPFTSVSLQLRRRGVILINLPLGASDFAVPTDTP